MMSERFRDRGAWRSTGWLPGQPRASIGGPLGHHPVIQNHDVGADLCGLVQRIPTRPLIS